MAKKQKTAPLRPQYKIAMPTYKEIGWGTARAVVKKLLEFKYPDGTPMFPIASKWTQCFPDLSRNEAICPSPLQYPELPAFNGVLVLDTDIEPQFKQVLDLEEAFRTGPYQVLSALYRKNSDVEEYCVSVYGGPSETQKIAGMVPVRTVGMGCAFIDMELLRRMPKPWFHTEWQTLNGPDGPEWRFIPEDEIFCQKVIAQGAKVGCHFDIEVKHHVHDWAALDKRMLCEVSTHEKKT